MPKAHSFANGASAAASKNDALLGGASRLSWSRAGIHRFGTFEVDFHAGELRKAGMRLDIQDQPLQVLSILLSRRGELVTRDEFRDLLWPDHTFVDFDHSLNCAIRKLRHALNDDADTPRLIETLPRHGYRFIGPGASEAGQQDHSAINEIAGELGAPKGRRSEEEAAEGASAEHRRQRWTGGRARSVAMATGLLVVTGGLLAGIHRMQGHVAQPPLRPAVMLAVVPLNNLGRDLSGEFMSEGVTEELITRLGKAEDGRLGIIAHTSVQQYRHTTKPVSVIGKELGVDYVLEGSARVDGNRVRIALQLIRVSDQTHVWAEAYDRTLDDRLGVQAEVAASVVQAIHDKLRPPQGDRGASRR
jgi:TolB-like protein/DNA-binding winged helix-turn-helix (wHTH) protein